MSNNKRLAEILNRIADFLELKGEVVYKINAYRRAARAIESISEDIEELCRQNRLYEIPGVGERIAKKIREFVETGTIRKYEKLRKEFPEELVKLLDVPYLGPKTLKLAYEKLGVRNLEDLKRVLEDGSLARLPGMGPKKVENIKKGLELYLRGSDRMLLGEALELVEHVISGIKEHCQKVAYAGSLRRMKETVGDIDILAVGESKPIMDAFTSIEGVTEVIAKGDTKSSILIGTRQVDIRVVEPHQWGAALQYFTGSKEHNVHLRELAKEKGLKINEYGVFKVDTGERIAGESEEEVYECLGLVWIPPELREDRGEIEAAMRGELPQLLDYGDIKGDLHIHSNWSDGGFSIQDIAKAAEKIGYSYIAITDHSKSVKIAHGLDEKRLLKQIEEIDRINRALNGRFVVLKGIEVDILPDGSLDLSDDVLRELDWVVASVHTRFNEDATERIIAAMENPYVTCIGHPTGRMLFQREGYPVDWEKVFEAAAKTGTCLEINAHQDRLDLPDYLVKAAKEAGVKFAIGTDAHHVGQLWMMKLGVGVARRGWLTKEDVVNCWDVERVKNFAKAKRR